MINAVLRAVGALCAPKDTLSAQDLLTLNALYERSGIPHQAFYAFRLIDDAEQHAAGLSALMAKYPTVRVLNTDAESILNGETGLMVWGHKLYALFAHGTTCQCCLGWRFSVAVSVALVAGYAAGAVT